MKQYLRFFHIHLRYVYQYYRFKQKYCTEIMREIELQFDENQKPFTSQQLKRIEQYMYMGLYVNDCLASLRGREMSSHEIKNTLYLCILTPILDDLTDNYHLSSEKILEQLHQEGHIESQPIRLAASLFKQVRNENELFPAVFKEALISQDESLKQLDHSEINTTTLLKITCAKGGIWTFLFRLMLNHPIKEGEKEAIEDFGALIQLTNDMFDVYKDVQSHQQTCFTNAKNITQLQQDYDNRLKEIMHQYTLLHYQKNHISQSLDKLIVMGALGKVCLEQLKTCQAMSGGIFNTASYSRKQLICDMEKWSNRLSYIKMTLLLYRWKID